MLTNILNFARSKLSVEQNHFVIKLLLTSTNSSSLSTNFYPIERLYKRQVVKNTDINYVKVGRGPHAVFCYPGVLGSMKTQLTELINHFESKGDIYTFYAWDQPGYGQTVSSNREFSDNVFQEDVDTSLELMKNLGHEKYSILGWSGGGLTSLLLAIQHSYIVKNLIVWGVFAYVDKEDKEKFEWFRNPNNWGGKMQDVLIEEYGKEFFIKNWQIWMDILIRVHTEKDGEFCSKLLHKITAPTFVLHGTKDLIVLPKHAHYLHKNIKDSRLLIMDEGKHNLQIRYHQEFFDAVHDFLQQSQQAG